MEFTKNEDFYHHILECGGVADLVETRKKKKKKRDMGGGLKSTVRMLKQVNANQEGIDTGDEQSPKKRPRPPPKVVQPVPLIPTHTRTTRYKETMKKEAKKIAAKERRIMYKGKRKSKKEFAEQRRIVAEVLDKVLSDVQNVRRKPFKSQTRSKPNTPRKETVQLDSPRKQTVQLNNLKSENVQSISRMRERISLSGIGRKRREVRVKTYKEDSSDSELNTKLEDDTENLDSVIESEALASPKTVLVTVVNDEILSTLTDIERMRVEPLDNVSSAEVPSSPPISHKICEDSPRILKRLVSTLVSDAQVPNLVNGDEAEAKHRARQQFSVETKMSAISRIEAGDKQEDIARDLDIGVTILESWWIRKSDIKTNYVNKLANGLHDEDFSGEKSRQRAKSLDAKAVPVSIKVKAIESISNGKSPVKVAKELGVSPSQVSFWIRRKDKIMKRNKRLSLNISSTGNVNDESSKRSYSLQFKKRVIKRIASGEEVSTVAKKLKIRENTVSVWWIRRDQIMKRQDQNGLIPYSSDRKDSTISPELENPNNEPAIVVNIPERIEKLDIDLVKELNDVAVIGNCVQPEKNFKDTNPEDTDQETTERQPCSRGQEIIERQPRSRRSVSSGARPAGPVLTSRWVMPLEVKQTALRRLEAGLTQAVVARDLDVSLSTVASWWRKKDSLLGVTKTESDTFNNKVLGSPPFAGEVTPESSEENHIHAHPRSTVRNDEIGEDEGEEAMSSPTKEPTSQIDDLGILELEQLMTDESETEMKTAEDHTRNCNLTNLNKVRSDPVMSDRKDPIDRQYSQSPNFEEKAESDGDKNSDLDDDDSRLPEALCLAPRPQSVSSLTSTPRPQSGLHLIVSSYCSSSEDEL